MSLTNKLPALLAASLLVAPAAYADRALVEEVQRAIKADPVVAELDLHVAWDGEAIVLEGEVDDSRMSDAAVFAAARVDGVDTIVNHIRIG